MHKIDEGLLNKLKSLNIEELKRVDLGPFNFEEIYPAMREFFDLLKFFVDSKNNFLPDNKIQDMENTLRTFLGIIDQIQVFDPKAITNPTDHRTNLINQMNNNWRTFFNNFHSWYSYYLIRLGNLEEKNKKMEEIEKIFSSKNNQMEALVKDYQGLLRNFSEELKKAKNENSNLLKSTKNETIKIREDARKFSAKDVVVKYAEIFKDQAEKEHKPLVKKWQRIFVWSLIGEIILGIAMIIFYKYNFIDLKIPISLSISVALMKIFVLSGGAIFVNYSLKNLNAHNHLYTLNKFRANAIASFRAFLNSSSGEEDVKDALLIQVAKAIYDPNVSGYLSKDDSSQSGMAVEIFKKIIDSK